MTAATMRREEANRNRLGSFESFVVVAQVHLPRTDCYQVIIDDATSDYYCCCAYYRIQLQQQHQQPQQSRDSSVTRRNCDSQARYITGSRYNKPT